MTQNGNSKTNELIAGHKRYTDRLESLGIEDVSAVINQDDELRSYMFNGLVAAGLIKKHDWITYLVSSVMADLPDDVIAYLHSLPNDERVLVEFKLTVDQMKIEFERNDVPKRERQKRIRDMWDAFEACGKENGRLYAEFVGSRAIQKAQKESR